MTQPFSFPGGVNTYIPGLSTDLSVIFLRSEYPINRYIARRKVPRQKDYYRVMKNDNQVRAIRPQDFYWADGNDAPMLTDGNDQFTYQPYYAKRYAYTSQLGYLGVEQGAWDVLGETSQFRMAQGMTARSARVATAITTSSNYPTANYAATAGAIPNGGAWSSATSTNPYILITIQYMQNKIMQATNGTVKPKDLWIVMNPTTAQIARKSQEFLDYLKQSPEALNIFKGDNYNQTWGLPEMVYGSHLCVDDTVMTQSAVNTDSTYTPQYTIPDNAVILLSKIDAITPAVGSSFSTFTLLEFTPGFEVNVLNDVKNRRYDVQIVENCAEQVLAGQSGFLVANVTA